MNDTELEQLKRQLAIYLQIARQNKNDIDMLPTLEDLVDFIKQRETRLCAESYRKGLEDGKNT